MAVATDSHRISLSPRILPDNDFHRSLAFILLYEVFPPADYNTKAFRLQVKKEKNDPESVFFISRIGVIAAGHCSWDHTSEF